ncbi:hypothetical protein [Scytonema sp. PCC 10023]|uniref:hypothetical protein n=1 Tax=Scytonema sp. PCC 10023 TaxID=1680591 RepID=UPI0039C670F7
MLYSRITWLIPLAFTLVGFGSSIKSATAQTTYPFEAVYDTEATLRPIPNRSNVFEIFVSGTNPDAPYGLTNFTSTNNYGQLDPGTGVLTFGPDPATLGLEGPFGRDEFFGSSDDSLFGSSSATALLDLQNFTLSGSGTVNITGGTGRFSGAIGTLNFFENDELNPDPTAPTRGRAILSGFFQVPEKVPEPRTNLALVGVGVTGAGFLLRQRRLRSAGKS